MGHIRNFLTDQWIEKRLVRYADPQSFEGKLHRRVSLGIQRGSGRRIDESRWATAIDNHVTQAELMYARGTPCAEVRSFCGNFARQLTPVVRKLDFSVEVVRREDGFSPTAAKRIAESHGGKWWKINGNNAGFEYRTIREPLPVEIEKLWMMAAMSGNRELAQSLAEPYRVPPLKQQLRSPPFESRALVLRHALAGDHKAEKAICTVLKPGYNAGWPPPLIDFPLAVFKRDASMLIAAVKKHSTTFKGKWDVRKYRKWYDKQGTRRPFGSFEAYLDHEKSNLSIFHWTISWWALAWVNVARWRNIRGIFDNPRVFSEWVPMEFCT